MFCLLAEIKLLLLGLLLFCGHSPIDYVAVIVNTIR